MAGRPPDPDAPAPLRAGTVLADRYRLERPLAVGGMARVWEARDEVLGRPVAVKVLLDHLSTDASLVARFRAEALAAARLTHPSVVSVYDTCSGDGVEAIVMELIDGTTLRHHLDDDGPLDPRSTARIAARIAEALAVAHEAGIVHRDVKPANVLLSTNGRVVVTDFGIAKATEGRDLTTDQQMLGTAKYLAPEQVEGRKVDGRADVYALGVVLFEMVTGEVPFRADTEAATALARLHHPAPTVRSRRPAVPVVLAEVIDRTLARDPDGRWPDAGSLARALSAIAAGREPALPPRPSVGADPAARPDPVDRSSPRPRNGSRPPAAPPDRRAPTSRPSPEHRPGPPAPNDSGANGWRPPEAAVATAPPADPPRPRPRRRRRRPLPLLILIAAAVLVAGLLVWGLGRSSAEPVAVDAQAFDPFGTGAPGENDDQAGLAVDGDLETAWQTERYEDPEIASYKNGVGLLLDVGETRDLAHLRVDAETTGWAAEVYVLDAAPGGSIDEWGEPVTSGEGLGETWETGLSDARGRIVLLWMTRTGDDGRVTLSEVTVEAST